MDVANVVGVLIIISLVWISALFRFSSIIWTTLIGVGLFWITYYAFADPWLLIIYWTLYFLAVGFVYLKTLRQHYLLIPFINILKKQIPPISSTEREAIEAGNTWWEKELFCGRPNWNNLFAIAKPSLSAEEQSFLDNQVEHLCQMLNDWQIVYEKHNLPENVWEYLKKERFLGMVIPKQYGGRGFSAIAHSTIIMKIATCSISTAVDTMVPNSLGPGELLVHYGTDAQKDYYLPRLACGAEIPCFALTAPEAGSDAGAIPDIGIICRGEYQGKEVLGIRLSWDKRYITLAPIATLLALAFHLYDPDHLLGDKDDVGITLALIPTSHPGVEVGNRHYPLLLAFMNGPTRGKDVFIPLDWIIGGVERAGKGWSMLMECLSIGRSISLPALATASGKVTYRYTGAYARLRRQFNLPISSFEGVDEALGFIAGYTYMLEACRLFTAGAVDLQIKPAIASAIAKYHMTELSRNIVGHAMDVHAGHMIQMGPRNFLAYIHLSLPISITVEGANILTRNLIIFGQGAIRCHPYLRKEIELISSVQPNVAELDSLLMAHVGYFISNFIRNMGYGITGGKLIFSTIKNSRIRKYQKQLTRMSAALALLADTSLIILGGSLKRRERISARLGDIMSQLYLASAVLKYYYDNNQPVTDVNYVCWALQDCLAKTQVAINEVLDNFPSKLIGKLLSWVIFPFGQAYRVPSDQLNAKVVQSMLAPSPFRDRVIQQSFFSNKEDDLGQRLDKALEQVAIVEPVWKKVNKALRDGIIPHHYDFDKRILTAQKLEVLTPDEASILSDFEALRAEIIKVNEFSFDLSKVIA